MKSSNASQHNKTNQHRQNGRVIIKFRHRNTAEYWRERKLNRTSFDPSILPVDWLCVCVVVVRLINGIASNAIGFVVILSRLPNLHETNKHIGLICIFVYKYSVLWNWICQWMAEILKTTRRYLNGSSVWWWGGGRFGVCVHSMDIVCHLW